MHHIPSGYSCIYRTIHLVVLLFSIAIHNLHHPQKVFEIHIKYRLDNNHHKSEDSKSALLFLSSICFCVLLLIVSMNKFFLAQSCRYRVDYYGIHLFSLLQMRRFFLLLFVVDLL